MSAAPSSGVFVPPPAGEILGHPKQLWMLFFVEFWERFAFYGMRWALTLYIVAQFFGGDASGEAYANRTYGAFLALVYATALFGGYAADKIIGYQRSILLGAIIMALGLFLVMVPNQSVFLLGLSVVIVGNGLFKPNISTMVGQLYAPGDARRDRGFTIFYMGINLGAFVAPLLTGWLASQIFGTPMVQNYKAVFLATGIGMLISLAWFAAARGQLGNIGAPPADRDPGKSMGLVLVSVLVGIPVVYLLMAKVGATGLAWLLGALFVVLSIVLMVQAIKDGAVQRDKVIAMLVLFTFNILFWMFFEQAGSSFTFLAEKLVDRDLFGAGGFIFPTGWFQSVNPAGVVLFAPVMAAVWAFTNRAKIEPSIARKFGLGLIFNALGFLVLMYALKSLVGAESGLMPFWPLVACYALQTIGELCLSPIGLSMVTKLAPLKLVGFAMGGWFLSTAIGNNLSGLLAADISGETGMTVASALGGFEFSFLLLIGAGVVLFLVAPLINKLMHGVK
jgi:proton-dependent oligopeptide transporter, POT family